ncbi:neuroblastoma breakpoint family member 26 isoform X2 [Pan troglodytes]|uniref:neuroblastoma breakpoint family member 26 isoform X2 n=1 Tax=Pan troglodytes TaxID=9598 RepID=UPI0023F51671|nr:neuroblastoma breakpoint family member 26 isoform X2 [Pan troglodytes]
MSMSRPSSLRMSQTSPRGGTSKNSWLRGVDWHSKLSKSSAQKMTKMRMKMFKLRRLRKCRNHLPPGRCRRLKKRKSLRTHWRNVPSLVQIAMALMTPTSHIGKPNSHLRKTKSTQLSLAHPLMLNGRMLYTLFQKMKVMMRKRKKKGQCLPGSAGSCWMRKGLKSCRTHWIDVIQLLPVVLNSLTPARPMEVRFMHWRKNMLAFLLTWEKLKRRGRGRKEGEEDPNPPCPRLNGMLMEVEEPEVLQDSLDRCYSTPSMYFELPDSFQHYRSVFYSFEEQHISFALYVDNRLNGVLMEVEEPEVLQDSLDRCYSTPSGCLELTDSCQPYRSAFYVLEQQRVGLAVDMDGIQKYQEVEEDQDPSCPRLSRELLDEKGPEVLQDSLDRCYSTPSGYLELPDLGQPYSSAVYSLEEQYLGLALDVDRIKKDQEEEEDQGPPCPRLSRELLDEKGPEVLQDSLDRCYSTPSSCLEQPDSCQAYGSSFYALEEKHVGFSLDVGEIEKGKGKKRRGRRSKKKRRRGRKEGEEDPNPPCPRLNGVLMEVEEPEVLQDSLDRCYSTPSMYFELPDSFQHYRSVFYSFEEEHINFALYVDNRFFTLTVTSLHLVFQMEVIFPQ